MSSPSRYSRRIVVFISLLQFCFLLCAQEVKTYVVSGNVVEVGSGKTLSSCAIVVRDENKVLVAETKTDADGNFKMLLKEGVYRASIQKDGYHVKGLKIQINGKDISLGRVEIRSLKDNSGSVGGTIHIRKEGVSPDEQNAGLEEKEHVWSGAIVEKGRRKNSPLPFAKLYVKDNQGNVIKRTVTMDDGLFKISLPNGKYEVLVTCTGYQSIKLDIEIANADLAMDDIVLSVGEEINAASIESETLIRRSGTRITYDVSRDPDAHKISMSEMAARIPELKLSARDGALKLDNQKFGKILINHTESGLINARRQYPMEFIKADYMRTIEVVLPGDPEYNNTEPIMLITLSRALPYGFASNLEMVSDTKNNHMPSVDLVANTPVIGVGVNYDYAFSGEPGLTNERETELAGMGEVAKTVSSTTSGERSHSHHLGANLFKNVLDERVRINASFSTSFSRSTSMSESRTNFFDSANELLREEYATTSGIGRSPFRFNAGLSLGGGLGRKGSATERRNRWDLKYTFRNQSSESETIFGSGERQAVLNGSKEHRLVASASVRDISVGFLKTSLSVKTGMYARHYDNSSSYLSQVSGLDYKQNVYFFDIINLGSVLAGKLGYSVILNGESLSNRGTYLDGGQTTPLDYSSFQLNPRVGLYWYLNRGTLSLSYSRNVKRPTVQQLSPYRDLSNPSFIRTGNPELKGEKTNSLGLSFSFRPIFEWMEMFDMGVSYSHLTDGISRIVMMSDDGTSVSTFQNLSQRKSYSFSSRLFLRPSQRLSVNVMADYSYVQAWLPSGEMNAYHNPNVSSSVMWHSEWIEIEGNVFLRPSVMSAQTRKLIWEPMGEVSVSRYFAKQHLGISFRVTDVFHSGGKRESVLGDGENVQRTFAERRGRCFLFRVYWRLGRFKLTEKVEIKAYDM